ncbi:MAG: tetratricopeptide repeat protein [Acidobacteriota bacterium]
MDRISRKELKQDRFAVEVTHAAGYLAEHRAEAIRYGIAGLVVLVLISGFFLWRSHSSRARREALTAALEVRMAPVGQAQPDSALRSFATEQEKTKAEIAAFSDIASKYPGSVEGVTAQFYLGAIAAGQGNLAGAEKAFKEVADSGNADYASLAKLSLADIYKSQGKTAEAEQLLRSLVAKPTMFVSKEEATIALARYIGATNPEEARKLLMPLTASRTAVSRVAAEEISALGSK